MDPLFTVEEFVAEHKKMLDRFARHWKRNLANPDARNPYPEQLAEGDWSDQLGAYAEAFPVDESNEG